MFLRAAAFRADAFAARFLGGEVGGVIPPDPEPDVVPPITYGGGHEDDYTRRVRNHWAQIDRLRAENQAREEAEREHKARNEARAAELVALEAERRRARAIRRREAHATEIAGIKASIAADEFDAQALRDAIAATLDEITEIQAQIQAAEIARAVFLTRRNAALALLLVATQ